MCVCVCVCGSDDTDNQINLKGMAVGNGCWGSAVGLCSFQSDMDRIWQQFLYGHNAITTTAYKKIIKYPPPCKHGAESCSH